MTSTQETEAFGRNIGAAGSTASPLGYYEAAGYRSDGDGPAGLEPYQRVGAQYYDATFGRFITRDTDLSQSPYAYCNGDPVNCSDPSGHFTIDIAHRGLPISGGMDPGNAIGSNSDWLIAASSSSSSGSSGKPSSGDGTRLMLLSSNKILSRP